MYKVAMIGDRDSIYGFESAGIEIFPILSLEEGRDTLERLAQNHYAVLYITESLYQQLQPQIALYDEQVTPSILPIPGVTGNTGLGLARISKFVERAVGSDILFGKSSSREKI